MKRLLFLLLALLAGFSAFGQDALTVETAGGQLSKIDWTWTSDGAGNASGVSTTVVPGVLYSVSTTPSTSAVPTDNYDIVVQNQVTGTDGSAVVLATDRAGGLVANRDSVNTELVEFWPDGVYTTQGKIKVSVSNAGASKSGRIVLTFHRNLSVTGFSGGVTSPLGSVLGRIMQWSTPGVPKWVTVSGDTTIADGGAVTVQSADDGNFTFSDTITCTRGNEHGNFHIYFVPESAGKAFIYVNPVGGPADASHVGFFRHTLNSATAFTSFALYKGDDSNTKQAEFRVGPTNPGLTLWDLNGNEAFHAYSESGITEFGEGGSLQGQIRINEGSSGNTPAYIRMASPNGTDSYLFMSDDNRLRIHTAQPTATSDGVRVGDSDTLGTMSTQDADSVAISGGTIDGTPIGGSTPAAGAFTTLAASGDVSLSGGVSGYLKFTGASQGRIQHAPQSGNGDIEIEPLPVSNGTAVVNFFRLTNTTSSTRVLRTYKGDGTSTVTWSVDAATGSVTTTGNQTVNGNTTLGDASTDTITLNARTLLTSVTDAGPMTATAGNERQIVYNESDSKVYVCTVTGSPATWVALH